MEPKHPLAEWRLAQDPKLTQADVASKLGVSRWTVNSIELGRRGPSVAVIRDIVKLTNGAVGFDQLAGQAEVAQ